MTLIDKMTLGDINVKFYKGIDFDILLNHPKDGSNGFIYCFIDNWVSEIKVYNRQRKILSVIDDVKYKEFDWSNIDNKYICIYQTDGIGIDILYQAIREKVISNHIPTSSYLHLTEYNDKGIVKSGGAIKIENRKIDD